jgi:hypothetical protein
MLLCFALVIVQLVNMPVQQEPPPIWTRAVFLARFRQVGGNRATRRPNAPSPSHSSSRQGHRFNDHGPV